MKWSNTILRGKNPFKVVFYPLLNIETVLKQTFSLFMLVKVMSIFETGLNSSQDSIKMLCL